MKRSENFFSIDLASSSSAIEPAANLTQIATSWDERGNKNENEELKRKGKRRNKKKEKGIRERREWGGSDDIPRWDAMPFSKTALWNVREQDEQ